MRPQQYNAQVLYHHRPRNTRRLKRPHVVSLRGNRGLCGTFYGKYQETKRNASIELTKKVSAILLYWGGLRGMTSDHLLSALSIATPFNLHLQAIRICGRLNYTDSRLISVGLPVRRSGERLWYYPTFSRFLSRRFNFKLIAHTGLLALFRYLYSATITRSIYHCQLLLTV